MAPNREAVIRAAEKYVSKGKLEAAIREYRKVLSENPNDANTLNRVGDLYARIGRFDEAVRLFSQIAEQYTRDGFFVKAIAIYKKIIKLNPSTLQVYERLAELYYKQGLLNEARTQYQVLADYYQKHDNAASAITIYQRMSELEPDNPAFHVRLAELYQSQRLIDKAMKEYRVLADLLLVNGSVDEAVQVYQRAFEVNGEDLDFIRDAVESLHDGGHVGASAKILALAVEINPAAAAFAPTSRKQSDLGRAADGTGAFDAADVNEADDVVQVATSSPVTPLEGSGEADLDETLPASAPSGEVDVRGSTFEEGSMEISFEVDDTFDLSDTAFDDLGDAPVSFDPTGAEDHNPDEVFTLDLDDDAIPDSQVLPPIDMDREDDEPSFDLDLGLESKESEEMGSGFISTELEVDLESTEFEVDLEGFESDEIEVDLDSVGMEADLGSAALETSFSDLDAADDGQFASPSPAVEVPVEETQPDAVSEGIEDPNEKSAGVEVEWELGGLSDLELKEEAFAPETVEPSAASNDSQADSKAFALVAPGATDDRSQQVAEPFETPQSSAEPIPDPRSQAEEQREIGDQPASEPSADTTEPDRELAGTAQRQEDLLAEAEVFAKYGLVEKAQDRLDELLELQPEHLAGLALRIKLDLDAGRHEQAIEDSERLSRLAVLSGDEAIWAETNARLEAAGLTLPGEEPPPSEEIPSSEEHPAERSEDRISQLLEDLSLEALARPSSQAEQTSSPADADHRPPIDSELGEQAEMAPVVDLESFAAEVEPAEQLPSIDDGFEEIVPPAVSADAQPPDETGLQTGDEIAPASSELFGEVMPTAELAETAAEEAVDAQEFEVEAEGQVTEDSEDLEIASAIESLDGLEEEFTVSGVGDSEVSAEQMFSEPEATAAPEAVEPAKPKLVTLADELDLDEIEEEFEPAPGVAADPLDETGMSWLDEVASEQPEDGAGSDSIFDEEDDFFDLAAELERELTEEGDLPAAPEPQEQSLEDIIEGFKKGVAENLSPEDFDTHFNLGIAYREMGLIDEAIGEFQLSSKDSRYLVESSSMLGICFAEKGLPELAVRWYRKGLESPSIGEEETTGLLYDMATSYLAMGDEQAAYKTFVEIYGLNSNFRDVATRMEELGGVSL